MAETILIVDDEANVREGLKAFLEDEGFDVLVAASAEEAIDLVDAGTTVNVVIMDLRLPQLDGTEAIRRIHQIDPELQFLIHTGSQGYTPPDDLRGLGVTDDRVFRKPLLDMGTIADAARRVLKG